MAEKLTLAEQKFKIWKWGLDQGWRADLMNCLYSEDDKGNRIRLNLRKDKLKLQVKIPAAPGEKKAKWVDLKTSSYENGAKSVDTFASTEVKKRKTRTRKRVKGKEK